MGPGKVGSDEKKVPFNPRRDRLRGLGSFAAKLDSPFNVVTTITNPVTSPNMLYTTLSSWCKNVSRLSSLIDRLIELAIAAPPEHRRPLVRQAAALRADFQRQQESLVAFFLLARKYADRFLSDISDEIQQRTSFLDAMERRLDMAKTLREQAVHLHKSYEVQVLGSMKKVRRTGVCLSYLAVTPF